MVAEKGHPVPNKPSQMFINFDNPLGTYTLKMAKLFTQVESILTINYMILLITK